MDFYTVRQKCLGAYHIATGKVAEAGTKSLTIEVKSAYRGSLKDGKVVVRTEDYHFEQSAEFLELEKDDEVILFLFCQELPEDNVFEVKYCSRKRLLPVKLSKDLSKQVISLVADMEMIERLREMHRKGVQPGRRKVT
jgi:hypothetical protein